MGKGYDDGDSSGRGALRQNISGSFAPAPSGMMSDVSRSMHASVAFAGPLALALVLSGGAGCGSDEASAPPAGGAGSGGGGGAGGGDDAPAPGVISWQADGVFYDSAFATASLVTSAGMQVLQVMGGEAGGIGVSFNVSAMPIVGLDTYRCEASAGGYPMTSFSYTVAGVSPVFEECIVNLFVLGDADGEITSGTFSAVFPDMTGGARGVSGNFNVPLSVSP